MQITNQWNPKYFLPESQPFFRMSLVQEQMAYGVMDLLRNILRWFPDNTLHTDMGLLLEADVKRYELAGRVIPTMSDLLFGQARAVTSDHLIRKFGNTYSLSVGAISFTTEGKMSPFGMFAQLAMDAYKNRIRIGDIWYVEGGAVTTPYIVISNSRYLFYQATFVNKMIPHTYYVSRNGGITATQYFINF